MRIWTQMLKATANMGRIQGLERIKGNRVLVLVICTGQPAWTLMQLSDDIKTKRQICSEISQMGHVTLFQQMKKKRNLENLRMRTTVN